MVVDSKKVSIIVPVYNVAQYLDRCIDSVVKQTYTNLEIILVDDGSTDDSLQICQKYAAKDNRIRLVYQANAGVDVARNNGLSHSTGELIALIDSDDFIEPKYIENLVKQMEDYGSDIAVSAYKAFHEDDGNYYIIQDPNPGSTIYDGCYKNTEWMEKFFPQANFTSEVIWSRLIKREVFDNIRFPLDMKTCDDAYVAWKLSLAADKISYRNDIDYTYRENRPGSAVTETRKRMPYDQVRVMEERMAVMVAAGLDTSYLHTRYKNRLGEMKNAALSLGDYNAYKLATYKLQMIDKYHQG